MLNQIKRYAVVGGNYYRSPGYGHGMFTSISVLIKTDNLEEANEVVKEKYDDCGGLIYIVDMLEGE